MPGSPSPTASRPRSWRNAAGTASPSTCSTACRTTSRWSACFQAMDQPSGHAAGARAVERARHRRQGARRRRLGRDLPDGEQRRPKPRRWCPIALYPPKGKRSNGPIRAGAYGEATPYQATANDEVLVIPMIETQEAIDNIDAILDVPGISGIYVGPSRPRPVARPGAQARPRGAADPGDLRQARWPRPRSAASSPASTTARRATPPR